MVTIIVDIVNNKAVKLEPNIIYRVGRRLGLEFSIEDESVELAHATIVLLAGGIVRLAAVNGDVFVNNLKTGLEIKSISEADAINGHIDLRFGNVTAKLRFNDAKRLDNEESNDTSGFDEDTRRDKSTNITGDSFNIPESEPQSVNNTGITDSFIIPETQAICFDRSARVSKQSKISLGDDILIPETQDVLLNAGNNPVLMNHELDIISEDDCSEFGTQIRICTQEFNEINEDAIDDFDSSLVLGDGPMYVLPPARQSKDNTGADSDMSALNWSASNSKCTALNSTKADDSLSRGDICLTPDLSLPGKSSEDLIEDVCTPDIFDVLNTERNERLGSCTPDLNLPSTVLSSPSIKVVDKPKQSAVDSIETPDSMPAELLDNSHCIATHAVPAANLTQERKSSTSDDNLEDFIATQAFVRPRAPVSQSKEFTVTRLSITAQIHNHNEDFIETQAFPTKETTSDILSNIAQGNLEDFIETQAFIKPSRTSEAALNQTVDTILKITAKIGDNTEDMLETQLFISPATNSDKTAANENDAEYLKVPSSVKMGDELDKELSQLIALSSSDEDEQYFVEQFNKTVENCINKIQQPKTSGNVQKDQQQLENNTGRKRSSRSESPAALPCKRGRTRQISKSAVASEIEENNVEVPPIENRTRLKRSLTANADPPLKKTRGKTSELISESASDAKAQKIKASNQKDSIEGRLRGRARGSKNTTQESENISSEVKVVAKTAKKQIELANEAASCSKESKTRKSKQKNDSSNDQPDVIHDIQPISSRTRRRSQLIDIIEETGKDVVKNKKDASKEDETLIPRKELRHPVKAPAKKNKAGNAHSTNEADSPKPKSKTDDKKEVSSEPSIRALRNNRVLLEAVEGQMKDGPTTSSNAQTMNARRNKVSSRNPVTEINDYIKKIKRSRKIRLALSMCNQAALTSVMAALKNAIEVTNDPVECDLVIMDRGERTYKFLIGVAGNKPILSSQWLYAMKQTCSISVESEHIFKDDKFEQMFKFQPLSVFETPSLLKGLDFMIGEGIQPSAKDMKAIIECAGGTVHTKVPSIASKNKLYVIASKQDKHVWQLLRNYKNVQYIKTEGVMQALVQHKVELLNEHKLNFLEISK